MTTRLGVLIVDDTIMTQPTCSPRCSSSSGHETFAAHDGLAAVEAAAKLDPDLILLDIGLPVAQWV
jgi:CheY-like chemotaxis protein